MLPEFNKDKATRIAYKVTEDWDMAEDAVQEALIYVWKNERIVTESVFYQLVRYRAINEVYKSSPLVRRFEYTIDEDTGEEEIEDFKDERSLDDVNNVGFFTIVNKLKNSGDREIVLRHFLNGDTYREIAEDLGISKDVVFRTIKRCVKELSTQV